MMNKIRLQLNSKYISEDVQLVEKISEIIQRDDCRCIVLQSPQGSGKNEFFNSLGLSFSILEPTKMLTEQQQKKYGGEILTGFDDTYIGEDVEIKATFASSNKAEASTNKLLIVDEAHKVLDYSNFAFDTALVTLETIVSFIKNKGKVILMSATPEPIIEAINDLYNKFIPLDYWVEVVPRINEIYLSKLVVVPSNISFKKFILENELSKREGKHVALIDTKDNLKKITEELINEGRSAVGITSENKEYSDIKIDYEKIVNEGMLSKDILNATSFIDCGINLYNEDIKHLYCMAYNIASTKQFFCRARSSKPVGYIQIRQLKNIDMIQIEMGKDRLYTELLNHAEYCLRQYKSGIMAEAMVLDVVGIVQSRTKGVIVSRLAIKHYIREMFDKLSLSTFEHIKDTLKGYYEEIELYSQEQKQERLIAQAQELLKSYEDRPLFKAERHVILEKLNSMGITGKLFKTMVEKCGYEVTHTPKKDRYNITLIKKV